MKINLAKIKRPGLIGKVALFFLVFIIVSLIVCSFVTYRSLSRTYTKLKCNEMKNISEYLNALIEKEGQSFIDYMDFYKGHYQELRIPIDLKEYQSAYEAFFEAFSTTYPNSVLYKDTRPSEMSEELQLLYYTYYHEYWLLTFDGSLEAFGISYAYFILMHEESYEVTYMIDAGGRIEDEEHPGYALIGETFYDDPEEEELMWRTWKDGRAYDEYLEFTDEYGHTYTSFVPVWINGQKLGLVGCDILVEKVNSDMLKRTIGLIGELSVLLMLMTVVLLGVIEWRFVLKIRFLSACVKDASVTGKEETAAAIRNMHLGRDELGTLSNNLADMLVDLDKHEKEVERVARMKSDFLANMSHEIRTPMNAVIGMTDLIQREKTTDTVANYAKQIRSSGTALLAIINDILDYSKIESGKFDIVPTEYHPVEVINDVSNIMLNKLSEKPVVLDVDVDPGLPVVLFGDSNRIRQILVNIAGNAVKYTNKGCVTIRAAFTRTDEENILFRLMVEDTGIGIKDEDKAKLFDSFTQVDSKRNRNVEGTGLGLTITKRLAELMNGSLGLESEYGKGSIFTVEIPQRVVDQTPASHVHEPEKSAALYMFSDTVANAAFERDATRLGVPCRKVEENTEPGQACLDMLSEYPGRTLYVFTDVKTVTALDAGFLNGRNDIMPVLVTDLGSKLELDFRNLTFATHPLYTANMAMIFNKEKSDIAGVNEGDAIDFTAPSAKILVVDDNPVNLTIAEGLLEPLKMNVTKAVSGKEAIKLCGNTGFDLIFMDHMMPEMDGVEAMKAIRAKYPEYADKPIIALTANAVGEAREMLLAEGMNDFISKPIDIKTLIEKVRKWLPDDLIVNMTAEEKDEAERTREKKVNEGDLVIGDLDVKGSVSMLGGETMFFKVLKDYYSHIQKKDQIIRKAWADKDWKNYTVEVHSLKSTSGQIGAKELQHMAAELEAAGRREDEVFINGHTEEMLERLMAYVPVFKPFCEESTGDDKDKPEADPEALKNAFEDFRKAADDLDSDAMEDIVARLSEYRYSDDEKELLAKLKEAVDNIDVETALGVIGEWEK